MAKIQASWKSALTPQKAPTYGNQGMLIASPKELQVSNVDYVVVFEGTKKYHVAIADVVNPYTLHVVIPEHDIAEEVVVKVYICQDNNLNILTHLKFTYISQMEHAIAKFLAHSAADAEIAEKLDALWTVCLGKDHLELWDKRLAQAFAQLELPIEWTLVGDILQKENESPETLLHFAARHGLKELINVFLNLPGAKQALSTYNKSGLLPRDVARESGRLDIAELLDSERSTEQRKSGTFKDSTRRKVRRNNDSGVTTITNLKNHNVHEDIQFLRELNKLKAKRNSPVNRHSWPVEIQSFNPDDYIEELEKELSKDVPHGEQNNTKRSFIDDNLIRLRDITEEICNLRSRNAEEASKEISMIADQNRRPAHSRRLSCPASVERRRRPAEGLPNLKSRPESSASERSIGNQEEPTNPVTTETVFSTPPISPPVAQLVNLASPTVTSPDPEGNFQPFDDAPESFMTPPNNTPPHSPLPKSPMPISLKYSEVEKRPNMGRKGRPRTWYGGAADIPPAEDEELRRSNSLEDFGKALDEGSDDESIASAASEANSKEGLLQTMCSLIEKESRTESFVSSISDISVGKESVGSDIESEHGDDCELEYTQEGIQGENVKDIDGYEGIQEREHEYTQDELEGHEETENGDTHNHDEIRELGDVEVHLGIQEVGVGIHGVVEGLVVDNGEIHENEKIEINGELDQVPDIEKHENLNQITAGSNVENNQGGDVENECQDTEHERKDSVHECGDTKHECGDTEHECKDSEHDHKGTEHECGDTEHECNDTEQKSKNTEEECKDTVTEQERKETEHESRDRNHLEHEQTEDTEAATNSNVEEDIIEEDIVSREGKQEENHESESLYEKACNGQQDNEVETSVVCNGVEGDVQEHEDDEEHIQDEVIGDENIRSESTEKNTAVGTSGQGDCNEDLEEELSNDNKESKLNEEDQCVEPGLEPLEDIVQHGSHADPGDSEVTKDLAIGENQLPHEDVSMENSSEEINLSQTSNEDAIVEETLTNKVADDRPEKNETSLEGNEDGTKESEGQSCGSEDVEEKSGRLLAKSEDCPTESGNLPRESEDRSAEPEDRPTEPEDHLTEFEDRPAESKNLPTEPEDRTGNQANDPEIGPDDAEDKSESTDDNSSACQTKIKYEDLDDIECNVQDFCLPGQNTEPNKELFRIQATDDVESGEDSDQGKHIQFDEKAPSLSPMAEERSPRSPEDNFCGPMRTRSALLLGVKAPVKRSGSDISVTSLQDVELDMHATNRDSDLTPGVLNNSRKAKSFGDLSTFSEGLSDITKDDGDDSEEERRRIQEDHTVLSRVKKFEQASKYASNEHLEQISTSRVIAEREEEKQNQRRWSNFFYPKNPKPGKKPGRTPTFRRDNLRSSMSSIGKGSKNASKNTIESLVAGPHSAVFAKHSQTAPNLHVTASGRPRSYTKDSPGSIRKSPTVSSIDSEEQKTESPEEVEFPNEDMNFEVDSDLENFDQEPEAWSLTVEKDLLKKMKKNEIKRQDVILELIQTEGHHLRTLKIMQQVFYRGLNKVANYPAERLDELFPRINDLVDISARFYRNLRCRQDESATVRMIGNVIVKQFSGDNGELVKHAYGEFVSKHPEAVALYKQYFKTDKKFSNFIKKCHSHRIVRRLSVPECFTLVTQRMTKYPLLIEAILKVTKSSNADYRELQKALLLVKDATKAVDNAIKDYEKQSRLKDIKMRFEKGSVVLKSGQKIKNSRFVEYHSKMIRDGILQWKNARGKLTETHVILLESMVAFLQENDKKFSLLSIDGKSPCIALKTLMVREVATDKCAIYFVSTNKKGPEMYEFVCSSQKEKRQWCSIITDAIAKAPEDTGDLFHSPEEEKKLAEERLKRRNEILEIMKGKDKELSDLVEEKNKLVNEMKELWQMPEGNGKTREDERVSSNEKARSILLSAIHRTTQLTADTVLIHESHSDSELAAATYDKKAASSPKRAETFGGFDRRPSQKTSRRSTTTIPEGISEENHAAQRRDSGLSLASESVVGLNTLSQGQEVGGSTSFQMLEALQWVLVQFSRQETTLETLRMELQATTEDIKKLRSLKTENDKKHFHMKEEHQAELTRQKKAYSDLERTFNSQVSDLKLKLSSQQEQQETLFRNFSELRLALTNK